MPGGMGSGHKTTISFGTGGDTNLFIRELTAPPIQGGGGNDTTTMDNDNVRTALPKKLYTVGAITMTVQYNSSAYSDIISNVNVNQKFTITFIDGDTLEVWGWIDGFVPGAKSDEGTPTAEVTLNASNIDSSGNEQVPKHSSGTTTTTTTT